MRASDGSTQRILSTLSRGSNVNAAENCTFRRWVAELEWLQSRRIWSICSSIKHWPLPAFDRNVAANHWPRFVNLVRRDRHGTPERFAPSCSLLKKNPLVIRGGCGILIMSRHFKRRSSISASAINFPFEYDFRKKIWRDPPKPASEKRTTRWRHLWRHSVLIFYA